MCYELTIFTFKIFTLGDPVLSLSIRPIICSLTMLSLAGVIPVTSAAQSPEIRKEVKTLSEQLLKEHNVPGIAIAVLKNGQPSWTVFSGVADTKTGTAITGDTRFNVGSISKCVAAWGVMQLVEQGSVNLDASIADSLKSWSLPESSFNSDRVTLRRMLSHTAGLSLHGYPGFATATDTPTLKASLAGETNGAGAVHLIAEPGSKWQYSGGGYTMAQLMLEDVTGISFAAYMKREVLDPLDMRSSGFGWSDSSNAATPHDENGVPIAPVRFAALAAAGLETTCNDLSRFAVASLNPSEPSTQAILKAETIQLMQRKVEPGTPGRSSGLGYQHMQFGPTSTIGHLGSNAGWEAAMFLQPESGDALIMLTNGTNGTQVQRPIFAMWAKTLPRN
jgi:CubicO group peptidase (beta-lactamase class C family)|tara:strand:- start:32993 stop:34165 length:1173 start_codon:yes stop_codon:yes gene_type:complete